MSQRHGKDGQPFVDLGIEGYERAVEVGRGGFSVVYQAWDLAFERDVAIKVVATDMQSSEVDRFARECAAIGRLAGHPNIVTVHTAGRLATGQPYIVMEYLSGGSLARSGVLRQPLPWAEMADIGVKLGGALESAHRAGVLHRDLKPGNVMLSRYGDIKLGDFGIARMEGRTETGTGMVAASWEHAPPEVVDGARPTAASDIYSLASTLFTIVDGRPPFARQRDESFVALLARIVRDPVRRLPANVPEPIARAIVTGLAKDPAARPESAAAFGRLLQAGQAGSGVAVTSLPLAVDDRPPSDPPVTEYVDLSALPPTQDRPTRRNERTPPPRRTPGTWARLAAGVVAAVVLALIAVNLAGGDSERPPATTTSAPASTEARIAPATTAAGGPVTTAVGPATTTGVATTTATGARLGQEVPLTSSEACRTPPAGTGAGWQLGPVQLGGRSFPAAYSCNIFAGGVGSLDFVLGGTYRQLSTSIGYADGSTSTSPMVRFEFIGDGRENLIEAQTLKFGDVRNLLVDVSGVTRLKIRITELSPAGGSEGASRPVLASPTLTR